MSNLKLPKMTFAELFNTLPYETTKKIAYETYIYKGTDLSNKVHPAFIRVMHHNSVIAELSQDGSVYVTNAGYSSSTTRQRVHKIIRDNNLPWNVSQKNFVQVLRNDMPKNSGYCVEYPNFESAQWDDLGSLIQVNGSADYYRGI